MTENRGHVTQAELHVLEVIWDEETATIRSITDRLYPSGGTSHYATVQKLLERLEAKGHVRRLRSKVPHRFKAKVARGQLIIDRLREIADSFCEGAMAPIFTHLVEIEKLSRDDVSALRDLVDRLEEEGKKR